MDSGEVPSASAVFSVAGVAPAPATDVAHLGATPWVTASGPHGPQLTGLTQSTADWAGPVTDMRAPPQKLKK